MYSCKFTADTRKLMMNRVINPPIVFLGGFLSQPTLYTSVGLNLTSLFGNRVFIVDARMFDWLITISKFGWYLVLNELDRTVRDALKQTGKNKAILVGHSQGGVLARLYLNQEPFIGKFYCGLNYIEQLITLGSPHINRGGIKRGGHMSRWIQQQVPGSAFAPQVRYTSVAGKYVQGNSTGTKFERFVFKTYEEICSDGEAWGDGIVPVTSALLPGSKQIILDGVSHYSLIADPWYGSKEILPSWWELDGK